MATLKSIIRNASGLVQKCNPILLEKDTDKLCGRVALLTGGACGIGYSIAKSLLEHGLKAITIADIDKENGIEAIKDLTLKYGEDKIMFVECDVSKTNQLDRAFQTTLEHYDRIDLVINNAGIMDDHLWQSEININLGGCVIGSLLGMQYMSMTSQGKGGIIVNIASIIGLIPSVGFPVHTMTQYGIVGLSRSLGGHYERTGVKVIGMCPGLTDTQLMETAHKKTINDNFCKVFCNEIEDCFIQSPDCLANGLVKIIDKSKPGAIWFMENNGTPREIHFPNVKDMIKESLE